MCGTQNVNINIHLLRTLSILVLPRPQDSAERGYEIKISLVHGNIGGLKEPKLSISSQTVL